MNDAEQITANMKRAYVLKFGNLYLTDKSKPNLEIEHCYRVSPWEFYPEKGKDPIDIKKITNCFEKSPQIKSMSFCKEPVELQWEGLAFDPPVRWHFVPVLKLELVLPVKNQKDTLFVQRALGKDKVETTDTFTVFFDGSNYVVMSKVKSVDKYPAGFPDVRDYVENLLQSEFKVESIAPNPMREFYYLLFAPDIDKVKDATVSVTSRFANSVLFILFPEKMIRRRDQIISAIFEQSRTFIDSYYAGSMIRQNMDGKYNEMIKLHMEIQKKSKMFFTLPAYRLLERRKTKGELEKLILRHYEIILDYNVCVNLIREAKSGIDNYCRKIRGASSEALNLVPFCNASSRLKDDLDYNVLDVGSYDVCLEYTKILMERTFSWKLAIYGAFFGAISALIIQYGPTIIDFLKNLKV